MNLAFFGTSNRSVPILESLKNSDFDLKFCVTKEDVVVGRKQELKPTAVKTWSEANGVQVVTIDSFSPDARAQISSLLKGQNIQIGVVADFSFIIPEEVFELPEHKFVNVHFSLLPKYRGASPVQFTILNQEKETGISYQIITKRMDEGPIIHQTKYPLEGTETTEKLYETLFDLSAKELPSLLTSYVEGKLIPQEQDHSQTTYTYSPSHPKNTHIFKEDAQIDWTKTPDQIDAMVRAYNPWPIAWTKLKELGTYLGKSLSDGEKRVKIFDTEVVEDRLEIKKLQVEGKAILDWKSFENGYLN